MGKEYDDYLKFIDDALELAKSIPKYFSKFSNRIYCNHQKLVIYVLMQKLKTTTRGIVSLLRASPELCLRIGLVRVPVHTTLVRFAKKIGKHLPKMLGIRQADTVAIDATGFELETKSYYYRTVWNSDKKQKTKRFMKLSLAIDADTHQAMTYKIRKSCAHDSRDFKILLKNLKCNHVVADKGYDSRELRRFVVKELTARPHIPYRKFSCLPKRGRRILPPDPLIYHKRSNVENVFFCIKQKYGSVLRNRTIATEKVELISKLIAHNVDRLQKIALIALRIAPALIY